MAVPPAIWGRYDEREQNIVDLPASSLWKQVVLLLDAGTAQKNRFEGYLVF